MNDPVCGDGAEHLGIRRGCVRPLVWVPAWLGDSSVAYRCVDCGMVFCASCAKRHFADDRAHLEEGARLLSAGYEIGFDGYSRSTLPPLDAWLEAERVRLEKKPE